MPQNAIKIRLEEISTALELLRAHRKAELERMLVNLRREKSWWESKSVGAWEITDKINKITDELKGL